MHRRALHFASVLLLLASLSTAEASTLRSGEYTVGGRYLVVLMAQAPSAICAMTAAESDARGKVELQLPVTSVVQYRTAWTMRPPSAHSATLHAVTGSSL